MILPGTDAASLEAVLAKRWDALRAWLVAAPRDPSVIKEINVHLKAWGDFEAQSIWEKDEGALSDFAAELNGAELTAATPTVHKPDPSAADYVPPGPPVKGQDIENIADLTKELPDATKKAIDDLKLPKLPDLPKIPWYWKAGAAVIVTGAVVGGAKLAYDTSPIGIAVRLRRERAERDEEEQRRKGNRR